MIDLGDAPLLSFSITDAAGVPTDATVVVTLTDPMGAITTPAVNHAGTGLYTIQPTLGVAGRWLVSPVSSGTVVSAQPNVLYVEAADPGFIISMDEARAGLTKNAADTAKDNDLRLYVESATPIIEDLCGAIVPRTVVETFDGGYQAVPLSVFPVLSITSVTEYQGLAGYTVNNEPLGGAQDGFGYTFETVTGLLTRRSTGGGAVNYPLGVKNVVVVYVAGRTTIPANVRLATRALVAHQWQHDQQGFRPGLGGQPAPGAMAYTPGGFAVPKYVLELVADMRRPAGMY